MKNLFLFLAALVITFVSTQGIMAAGPLPACQQSHINPKLLSPAYWDARWVSCPELPAHEYGVAMYRKDFNLDSVPSDFWVNVSADNRYKLYVNGQLASMGPTRGDVMNWSYMTVDLAPWLRDGRNVIAAEVWSFGPHTAPAQMSTGQHGLLVSGNSPETYVVNTDDSWKCMRNRAIAPCTDWSVFGYYVAGPCEAIDGDSYPWGWQEPGYDSEGWRSVKTNDWGASKGALDYAGRQLVPSLLPEMERRPGQFARIRRTDGPVRMSDAWTMEIPANSKAVVLIDNDSLVTAYPRLVVSGGKGAQIKVSYGECLYETDDAGNLVMVKGNRDDIEGKKIYGYHDQYSTDGGDNREFTTLWWRTFRYVELEISTQSEPLTINGLDYVTSMYPFELEAWVESKEAPEIARMAGIGWRTARLCANETYMDCPYYEQLQYFGDTRIQALVTMYNTRDTMMVRSALEQGRRSMIGDGLTMSRYPSAMPQFISSYSLIWICMAHDYWMYRADEEYVRSLLPAHRQVISWFEQYLRPDYSLSSLPYWFFVDWAPGFTRGSAPVDSQGYSALQDLTLLMALVDAAHMERELGYPAIADHYDELADGIRRSVRERYWDEKRMLFADDSQKQSYSQHANIMAILTDVVEGEQAGELMQRLLADESLIQSTVYFRYYLNQALLKAGMADRYMDNLGVWRDQMALGLTTWAEKPEPSRSDCHAWGASPNIEFYRMLLGIDSAAPGFARVKIEPALGALRDVEGVMPHPLGLIKVKYTKDYALIELPAGLAGDFVWHGRSHPLAPGCNKIRL